MTGVNIKIHSFENYGHQISNAQLFFYNFLGMKICMFLNENTTCGFLILNAYSCKYNTVNVFFSQTETKFPKYAMVS